jgi:hypothetical protein
MSAPLPPVRGSPHAGVRERTAVSTTEPTVSESLSAEDAVLLYAEAPGT